MDLSPVWYGKLDNQRRAKARLRDAVLRDLDDRQRRLRIALGEHVGRVGTLRDRLDVLEYREIPKLARQLEVVRKGYQAGGLSNLAVLEAQRRVVEVVARYLSVLNDYHQELLLLQRETGMGAITTEPKDTSRYVQRWLFEDEEM